MNSSRSHIFTSLLVFVVTVVIIAGCKPSIPDDYIQPDEMEDILYDYYVSKAMANRGENTPYERTQNYLATLKKHGVSEAEFDSSLVYYYTHAQELSKIYKKVSERIGDEAKQLGASVAEMGEYGDLSANGDTANVWRDATATMLLPTAPYNRFDFAIKVDTTYHRGDSFILSFTTDFMYQSGNKDMVAYVVVKYDNDSIAVVQNHVARSGVNSLRITANAEQNIKELRGFFYLAKGWNDTNSQKLLFLDNIKLIRFRLKEQDAKAIEADKPDSVATEKVADTLRHGPKMVKVRPLNAVPTR